jgi:CheY-like chemotaxis protein
MPTDESRRVLVVEDYEDIRELLAQSLEEAGYAVDRAANGLEALAILRSGSALPAVILLDLMMPVMDGVEFCAQKNANAATRDIPVIAMSAANHPEALLGDLPARAIVRKPMALEEVLEAVERCCGSTR